MSVIELIPLDKGNRCVLDQTIVTTIGRTQNVGCLDKKISRNHAELFVKSDGTLWIKPIHTNPTFYRGKSKEVITLKKDEEHQLNHNDEIGLLPNEYFYRISMPSAIPKSPPIQERESSPIDEVESLPIQNQTKEKSPGKDPTVEKEGGIILHTSRALPEWMSNTSSTEPAKNSKGRGKTKTPVTAPSKPSPSKYRTYIGRQKVEGIVYEDDDDDDDDDEQAKESKQTSTTASSDPCSSTMTNSTKRERCPYGKFCYRKNPLHRQQAIHPGDPDWDDKENNKNTKKLECPYGSDCYRKNPDHFKEYSHTNKRSSIKTTESRKSKRKGSDDDDEDDDDGLPNEYDYNDSFIDDEDLEDSARVDRAGESQDDPDADWRPHKKARHFDDDNDDDSSVESEVNLLNEEAAEFIQSSTLNQT